jgi:CheY-like chemotaxis protein
MTGVYLTIVLAPLAAAIIAGLGGHLNIDSTPGQGTSVRIRLPIVPEIVKLTQERLAIGDGTPKATTTGLQNGHVRLLVVDDHAMVREGLATLLNDDERLVVVGEAADGIAAIEAVATLQPEVILIDVNMPRMNGIEAAREVKRRWPHVIIIGLSVQDDETTARAMREAGASAFLSKSADSTCMIETIFDLVSARNDQTPTGL